jgi:hypothetical protein
MDIKKRARATPPALVGDVQVEDQGAQVEDQGAQVEDQGAQAPQHQQHQ